jgi:hypothetical protein
MSWKKLLQDNKVHTHTTSIQELTEIRRLIAPAVLASVLLEQSLSTGTGLRYGNLSCNHQYPYSAISLNE